MCTILTSRWMIHPHNANQPTSVAGSPAITRRSQTGKHSRHTSPDIQEKREESYFALLLSDQAKALSTSPEQMRWHPAVLRWCLQQYSRSGSAYESMRSSGFLKLPSGRTLLRYRNYSHPKTGWQTSTLDEMRALYDKFVESGKGKPDRSFIGGLFFDEMKIKEGLVWDCSTNELVGFVDYGDVENDDNDQPVSNAEALATHAFQFHFRSLFSSFSFPCAYYFTRAPSAGAVHDMFWRGVSQLDMYGFQVIMACCDGAACNRKFIRDSSAPGTPGKGLNPFGQWPIFYISDPTHLIKKMRNNLSKSGYSPSSTRVLTLNGQSMLWSQIRAVYDRDKCRPLHYTPLREEHVQLNSFSRMRSRLAFDIFNKRVEEEMKSCQEDETKAIREFIGRVRTIIEVFCSNEKLGTALGDLPKKLMDTLNWFREWKKQCTHEKQFVSPQVYEDLQCTVEGFLGLLKFMSSDKRVQHMGLYVFANRLNQDFVEGYFGLHRSSSGCNQNMTARAYGYQTNSLRQTHVLPANLGSNALELPLPR